MIAVPTIVALTIVLGGLVLAVYLSICWLCFSPRSPLAGLSLRSPVVRAESRPSLSETFEEGR